MGGPGRGTDIADINSPTPLHNPALSDDERHVLADTSGESNAELQGVWRIDLERGSRNRMLRSGSALWAPDGQQVAFANSEGGVADIFVTPATGQNERKELLRTGESKGVNDWSRDGWHLVFISTNPETKSDLWVLPVSAGRRTGAVSPDIVRRAAGPGVTRRALAGLHLRRVGPLGSLRAVVPHAGHEVRDLERRRRRTSMAGGRPRAVLHGPGSHADVGARGLRVRRWTAGVPSRCSAPPVAGDLTRYRNRYQVAANGQRFLLDSVVMDGSQDVTLVVNWQSLGRR